MKIILPTLLIAIGAFLYTSITEGNTAMYRSLTAYDASQNTEDYGFILRNKLAEEQYHVNLYDYQKDFITQIESKHNLIVETSFNKMLTNETNGHQYRVFSHSGSINKPYIVAGSLPAAANELTVLPEYAKYNSLNIGDSLDINGVQYIISGFVYHPAYITPIVTTNVVKETSIYYPNTQSIIFMTEGSLNNLNGQLNFAYKSKTNQNLTNDEKNALFNKLYMSNDFEVIDNALTSITHGETYSRINGLTAVISFIAILICGSCMFVSMQTIKRRIEADKKQLGTLKALGYKSWEIAKSYSVFAVAISVFGGIIGCAIGFFAYRPLITCRHVLNWFNRQYHVACWPDYKFGFWRHGR
jgi:ABC-type antimicrobial peptide transport system permease subunit